MAKEKGTADKKDKKKSKDIVAVEDSGAKASAVVETTASPAPAKPATKSMKVGKLLPKNKSRLPRRQKKERQKAAGRL